MALAAERKYTTSTPTTPTAKATPAPAPSRPGGTTGAGLANTGNAHPTTPVIPSNPSPNLAPANYQPYSPPSGGASSTTLTRNNAPKTTSHLGGGRGPASTPVSNNTKGFNTVTSDLNKQNRPTTTDGSYVSYAPNGGYSPEHPTGGFDYAGRPLGYGGQVVYDEQGNVLPEVAAQYEAQGLEVPGKWTGPNPQSGGQTLAPGQSFNSQTGIRGPQGATVEGGDKYIGGSVGTDNNSAYVTPGSTPGDNPLGKESHLKPRPSKYATSSMGKETTFKNPAVDRSNNKFSTGKGVTYMPDAGDLGNATNESGKATGATGKDTGEQPANVHVDNPNQDLDTSYDPGKNPPRNVKINTVNALNGELGLTGKDAIQFTPGQQNNIGKHGGYGTYGEADAAKKEFEESIKDNPALAGVTFEVVVGKDGYKINVKLGPKGEANIDSTLTPLPGDAGLPPYADAGIDTNQAVSDLTNALNPTIINNQQGAGQTFNTAQGVLQSEIPNFAITSPQQQAEIDAEYNAYLDQSYQDINDDYRLNTRAVNAELQNSGWASSNLAKYVQQERAEIPKGRAIVEAQRKAQDVKRTARNDLVSNKQKVISTLQGQKPAGYPDNIPQPVAPAPGTYTAAIDPNDWQSALKLIAHDIPEAQAKRALELLQTWIESGQMTKPSLFSAEGIAAFVANVAKAVAAVKGGG